MLGNKTCEIRDYINDNKLDILVLTETWLNKYDSAKICVEVKQSPSIEIFKKRLKTHIFADCYQSGEMVQSYRT